MGSEGRLNFEKPLTSDFVDTLPLYALPLIFPYDSYLGNLCNWSLDWESYRKIEKFPGLSNCPGRSPFPRCPVSDVGQGQGCGTRQG